MTVSKQPRPLPSSVKFQSKGQVVPSEVAHSGDAASATDVQVASVQAVPPTSNVATVPVSGPVITPFKPFVDAPGVPT